MTDNRLSLLIETLQPHMKPEQMLANEPMSRHTTFAVGGPADLLLLPYTVKEMSLAIRAARALQLPITVLGGGSNVLVLDGGIRGAVIQLQALTQVLYRHDDRITASAGHMLADVCEFACAEGLGGAEFACGIPGTLGGAVFMNAGAYDGEMSHIVARVRTVDHRGGVHTYAAAACRFAYRRSRFQETQEYVVEAELLLHAVSRSAIQARMEELMRRRRSKQPLEMASAGSTFKRPPGYFAGTLIDQTGLKGLTFGGAQVSTKHAGFVVNTGRATARDVLQVIHAVQERVEAAHGVRLEPEVRILGEK